MAVSAGPESPPWRPLVRWPDYLAWALYVLALVQAALNLTIVDLTSPRAIAIYHLYTPGAIGAVIILLYTAWRHPPGARRWTWILYAGSFAGSIVWIAISIEARRAGTLAPPSGPFASLLLVLMYGFAIGGAACYFLRRAWWFGTVPRVVMDSTLVGCAGLLVTYSLLPASVTARLPGYTTSLWIPAFDLGAVFAFGTVAIRYRRNGSPLLLFSLLSVVCLLLGDLAFTIQILFGAGVPRGYASFPLYILHHVFLARGAYLSLASPPHEVPAPEPMPFSDWFLWALVPRVVAIAALTVAVATMAAPQALLWVVLGLIVAREALAWHDLYRVSRAFNAARAQLLHTTQRTHAFLTRIAHDLGIALQALWSTAYYLPLPEHDARETHMCLESLSQLSQSVRNEVAARWQRAHDSDHQSTDAVSHEQKQPLIWTQAIVWALPAVAVVCVAATAIVPGPPPEVPVILQALSPLIAIGAMALLISAAEQSSARRRRRLWQAQALVAACSAIVMGLAISGYSSEAMLVVPLNVALVLLTCLGGGLGLVAYLPRHFWQMRSFQRLIVESVAVSSALVVIAGLTASWLTAHPLHTLPITTFIPLALGLGMLYLVLVVGWSTRRRGGQMEVWLCLALFCLVISNGVAVLASALPNATRWYWLAASGYSLQYALLALAAHHMVRTPSAALAPTLAAMPLIERLLWTAVARALAVVAVALVALGATPIPGTLQWLLLVTIGREALAARDQRRVLAALSAAKQQAHQANVDMLTTLDRVVLTASTPLANLWSIAHQLDKSEPMIRMFWEQLAHMERLVGQLRIYVQARTVPLVLTTVDLEPICVAAVQAAQELADAAIVRAAESSSEEQTMLVTLAFETANIAVRGDPTAIRRVLDNLLSNAVKATAATRSGGIIELAIRDDADPQLVVITVTDRGAGVPPHLQGHIFEPHVGLGSGGLGLGLAIVSELVEAMGGSYELTSGRRGATLFSLRLQRAERAHMPGAAEGPSMSTTNASVLEREVAHASRARD